MLCERRKREKGKDKGEKRRGEQERNKRKLVTSEMREKPTSWEGKRRKRKASDDCDSLNRNAEGEGVSSMCRNIV